MFGPRSVFGGFRLFTFTTTPRTDNSPLITSSERISDVGLAIASPRCHERIALHRPSGWRMDDHTLKKRRRHRTFYMPTCDLDLAIISHHPRKDPSINSCPTDDPALPQRTTADIERPSCLHARPPGNTCNLLEEERPQSMVI